MDDFFIFLVATDMLDEFLGYKGEMTIIDG